MTIIACGINHKTAPLAVRERVAFTANLIPAALRDLLQLPAIEEAVLLSTCNRTEVYSTTENPHLLVQWLAKQHQFSERELLPHWYLHQNEEAVRHVFRVASGLDSMMTGEPQILGQIKQAYAVSKQQGGVGKELQQLFQTVFAVTKQVRRDTAIGRCPVTVAFAATHLAKKLFVDLTQSRILLIGAGKLIELVALHLANHGAKRLIVANRSLEHAQEVANKFLAHAISLNEIPLYLQEVDIVITAASSESFLVTQAMVERVAKLRTPRPLFIVDLAVPRNVEPSIALLPDTHVYHIDDLEDAVQDNLQARSVAATDAEAFIDMQTTHFMRKLKLLNASDVICSFRDKMTTLHDKELEKALNQLQQGMDPKIIMTHLSKRLTSKMLHRPTRYIRQVAMDDRVELLMLIKQLFDL